MEKDYYSIGEVAKLANLSIQTLHYYDQIDLFKPSYVDASTNYRYYRKSQLYILDMIKSLKFVGTSLKDIKIALHFTPAELLAFLEQQESVIESHIQRLQEIHQSVYKSKKQLQSQLEITVFNEVYERREEEVRTLNITIAGYTPQYVPDSYYSALTKIVETEKSTISSNRYGCTYTLADYASINEIKYDYVFTPLLTDRYLRNLSIDTKIEVIPAGRYLCIAFIYDPETYFNQYQRLYCYIQEKKLPTSPLVYEQFMPTKYSQNAKDEFIVELKVQLL